MSDIRFDGQVAIVTGAGGGLGKQHALELARRGAKVVINDLGGTMDGTGGNSAAAEAVVAEIIAAGGEAIANGASVTDDAGVAGMVEQVMAKWGRIDILIANAGILREASESNLGNHEDPELWSYRCHHLFVWPLWQLWPIQLWCRKIGSGRLYEHVEN